MNPDTLTTVPMPLALAQSRAEKLAAWLTPYCERIAVAGSIRRGRPLCNDVDLVCIPKFAVREDRTDMFTTERRRVSLLRDFLRLYCEESKPAAWRGRAGQPAGAPKEDAENLLLVTAAGVQLDVWVATEATWWTRLICRTGSVQHNILAAQRALDLGGKWSPYQGLRLHDEDAALTREEDFYAALGWPCVPPNLRDTPGLNRFLLQNKLQPHE